MKTIQLLVIGIVVGCIIFFMCKKYVNSETIPGRPIEAEMEHYYLKGQMSQWLGNEGLDVKNIKLYYGNDTSKTVFLYDLIKKPTLIYYVSGKMCSDCIRFGVNKTKEYFGEFENNPNAILITTDVMPREKKFLYNNHCYSYVDNSETLNLPIEATSVPFFFVMETDRKVSMFFLPDSTNPIYTEKYLEIVSRRFIKQ